MKKNAYGDMGQQHILLAPTPISGTTPIQVIDDMTNFDGAGYVLVTTGTVAGAWTFQGINGYRPVAGMNNSIASAGQSGNVTSLASPATTNPAGSPTSQCTQFSVFMWGACGITFTPTSGAGNIAVYRVKKGND